MTALLDDATEPTPDDLLAQLAAWQGKLANLAAIEQAKGALMVTYGLTADAAFELLRFHSQTRNVKLRAIADQLTSLLSSNPTSLEAITQFDQLLDTVTRRLQSAGPADQAVTAPPTHDTASLWSQLGADQDPGPSTLASITSIEGHRHTKPVAVSPKGNPRS